jgi:glucose/arabinose dehydrogenase
VRRLVTLLVVGALAMTFGAGCGEPSLAVVTVASNLDHPWDVGFLPGSGTMLVTERPGRLSRIVNGQRQLIVAPPDVVAVSEAGMLGLAIDPSFRSNGFVFVCMASNASGRNDVRIVRFTLSQDARRVLARVDIFKGMPFTTGRHAGCRPRFGPDGFLWVGTGDAATGTVPQDPHSAGGKVLRLRRTGAPAPGNPLGLPWYTRGHRNVQGLAFRRDGLAVAIEQGTDRDDEVTRLRLGGNGGWHPVPGYNEARPMTDRVRFPDAMVPLWASGFPTLATSGGTFLDGPHWGRWNGALAIATLKARHLHVLLIDKHGKVVGERKALTGFFRLRQAVQGPDGNLYVTTDNGNGSDVIVKVTPSVARN